MGNNAQMAVQRILITDSELLTHPDGVLAEGALGEGEGPAAVRRRASEDEIEVGVLRAGLGAQTVVYLAQCRTEEDLLDAVMSVQPAGMIVQWAPVTARVLAAATHCRVISRLGIGLDMVDLGAAERHGVIVRNVPDYCIEEVATHAFAGALALWRRLPMLDAEVRLRGEWAAARSAPAIGRLSDACIGLVGCGRIGRLVAQGFQAWGAEIIVADPGPAGDDYPRVDLLTLAARADVISLHAPLTEETAGMIDAEVFAAMARRPILVNASRGGLIDEGALIDALRSGTIAGAALDVFATEPLGPDSPLRGMENVILTPHAAWVSRDALPDLRRRAAEMIVEVLGER